MKCQHFYSSGKSFQGSVGQESSTILLKRSFEIKHIFVFVDYRLATDCREKVKVNKVAIYRIRY